MLKLWGRVSSANVQKVLWVLDDLGLAYSREEAGLQFSANKTPEYLLKNPNGRVPLLEDGAFRLWESNAICRYLCNRSLALAGKDQPEQAFTIASRLYPQNSQSRGLVDQWLDWTLWGITAPMVIVFQQHVRISEEKRDKQKLAEAEQQSNELLEIINQQLLRSPFLVGDELTLADVVLAPTVYRANVLGLAGAKAAPLKGWLGRLSENASYNRWVSIALT
jgi:glutathione S-transferase